jgi:hypothetical protein
LKSILYKDVNEYCVFSKYNYKIKIFIEIFDNSIAVTVDDDDLILVVHYFREKIIPNEFFPFTYLRH